MVDGQSLVYTLAQRQLRRFRAITISKINWVIDSKFNLRVGYFHASSPFTSMGLKRYPIYSDGAMTDNVFSPVAAADTTIK